MARPKKWRRVLFFPRVTAFIPHGKRGGFFNMVEITREEVEAVRLKNILGLEQIQAAEKMKTSQSTFQRILSSAYQKIAQGIIYGRGIKIK
ncbi:MAG: DUF134 domain-containing protein [Patescibacteria group bacterium]